jgi:hypothetical protein
MSRALKPAAIKSARERDAAIHGAGRDAGSAAGTDPIFGGREDGGCSSFIDVSIAPAGGDGADVDATAADMARVRDMIDDRRRVLAAANSKRVTPAEAVANAAARDASVGIAMTNACRTAETLATTADRLAELGSAHRMNITRILADESPPTYPAAPANTPPEVALRGRLAIFNSRLASYIAELDAMCAAAAAHSIALGTAARDAAIASGEAVNALRAAAESVAPPATPAAPHDDVFTAAAAAIAARDSVNH